MVNSLPMVKTRSQSSLNRIQQSITEAWKRAKKERFSVRFLFKCLVLIIDYGLHFSAIAYQKKHLKMKTSLPKMTHYQGGKKEKKKSININTPSAVVAKTDPISTSCSQPASTRITPALLHQSACTRVHASGQATSELSRVLSKCQAG